MVKEGELKVGDKVVLDSGFTCRNSGPAYLEEDTNGLYFHCDSGKHYIDGQLDEDDVYIGLEKELEI